MEEKYRYFKDLHPDWSHEQIMAAVSISMSAGNEISKAGPDISPNEPELVRSILQNARDWLKDVLPDVFKKVSEFFDILINNVGSLIGKGLTYIIDSLDYLYQKGKIIIETLKMPVEK